MTGFTLASLFCGIADSAGELAFARMVQGTCAAAILATMIVLMGEEFTGRARERAIAVWASTVGAAVVSSALITSGMNWRAIFLVNLPLGTLALVLVYAHIQSQPGPGRHASDLVRLLPLSAAVTLLTAGLLHAAETHRRGAITVMLLSCGVVLMAVAIAVRARGQRGPTPHRYGYCTGLGAITLFLGAGTFWVLHVLTSTLPHTLGAPARLDMRPLPFDLPVLIVPVIAAGSRLPLGSRCTASLGVLLAVGGLLPLLTADVATTWAHQVPELLIAAIGAGLATPGIAATALATHPTTRLAPSAP